MLETERLKKTLLIIDNSIFIIDRLLNFFKEAESLKKVNFATNYTEALDSLQHEKADIVLLDIRLSEKNGIELLKYIVEHYKETKVVVLSNLVSKYYQDLCKSLGAVYYIDKSTDFEQILEVVVAM